MKKAIYLIGNVGSGKDFLLRNTSLRNLKEIHNDRLCKLYHSGNRLSDNRILVNCAADSLEKILESKRLLESTGYETLGVFVYTTNEVSRERSVRGGSRTLNEAVRTMKYQKGMANLGMFVRSFYESLLIYNNSDSTVTENVKGWLAELNEEVKVFLEGENPGHEQVTGQVRRGHGTTHKVDAKTSGLEHGHPADAPDTVPDKNQKAGALMKEDALTERDDKNAMRQLASGFINRRRKNLHTHMKKNGIEDHPNLKSRLREEIVRRTKKAMPPPEEGGTEADAGCGITPTGDGTVSEFWDFGKKYPPFTGGQLGKDPNEAGTEVSPGSVGGFNAGTASTPVNSMVGGTLPSGAAINANKMAPNSKGPIKGKPPTSVFDGRGGEDGTESGGGVPGGATNEHFPDEDADASISGTPGKGDSIAGTMSESKRAVRNKQMARTLTKRKLIKKTQGVING